jgi:hypothetical protein
MQSSLHFIEVKECPVQNGNGVIEPRAALKVGLLTDDMRVSKYTLELLEWAKAEPSLVISHLIVYQDESTPSPGKILRLARRVAALFRKKQFRIVSAKFLFRAIVWIEQIFLRKFQAFPDHLKMFDPSSLIPEKVIIRPERSRSGLVARFSATDITRVKSLGLDVIIRAGGGIIRGEILAASTFGIVSFHHGDNRVVRGSPAGFWEVFYEHDTTGFTIQLLTEELDGGQVILRGHFPTRHFFLLNQAALYRKSNFYLQALIKELASTRTLPHFLSDFPYSQRLYKRPETLHCVKYLLKNAVTKGKNVVRKFRNYDKRWHVAYVRQDWRNAVLWRGVEIENPPFHFLADPFVITRNDKDYCFLEDYDYKSKRGSIAVYELGKSHASRLGVALEEEFHLSFPFLFEFEGDLFMCPEACEKQEIRIYRCSEFPLKWELCKIVMSGVNAGDTMIFARDGLWWMFTNIDPVDFGDHCSELSIFYSSNPIAGEWMPHPQNPIYIDASRARNAGLLSDGFEMFRVSQRQGFDQYGKGADINQIVELTTTDYSEDIVATIAPKFRPNLLGTHHMHSNGCITAFDYVDDSCVEI